MNRFKNQLLLAAGFAVLAGVVSGITAAPAIAAAAVKAALIKSLDEPGRTPYQFFFGCNANSAFCSGSAVGQVPVDKRLVIQHVSIFSQVPFGAKITDLHLFADDGDGLLEVGEANLEIHPQFRATKVPFGDNYDGNEVGPVFVDAGQTLIIAVQIDGGPKVNVSAYVTGYLVDLTI